MSDKELQPRFTSAEDELLIELVAEVPILYDTTLKEFKNIALKDTKWKQIGEAINKRGDQCKTRWRSIRDHYKKLKKADKLPTGTAALNKRKTCIERLRFLERVESERESTTNERFADMPDDNEHTENDGDNESNFEEGNISVTDSLHLGSEQEIESSPRPPPVKKSKTKENEKMMAFLERKSKERNGLIKNLEASLREEEKENEIDLFFKSMAASVKKFPPMSKTYIKQKIAEIVFGEESRLGANASSSTQLTTFNYSYPPMHLTSAEHVSPRPPLSDISNFSYELQSLPPNYPQPDSDVTLQPYWRS